MKKAEDAIGTYSSTTATGTAGTLGNALKSAGIAWDGTAAGFNSKEIQTKLEAAYGDTSVDSEALKNAVKAYTDDVADYDKAKAGVDDAAKAYGEAQKQLAALTAQETLNSKVDAANTLKDALVTVFKSKMEEQATAAPADKISYSDINGFKAADGGIDGKTAHADVANTAENREKAVAAFEDALNKAMNTKGKEGDAVDNLLAEFKLGTTAITDVTGFKTAAGAVGTARTNVTAVADDLKAAQEQVVSKFSGPAVLTGNTVGVNAAGNVVETASGEKGITITANQAGIGGQISGFNISVSDSEGKVKKSANASLDAFSETVRAQNKSEDNAVSLQVGANANQSIKIGLTDMRSEALGLKGADGTTLNISTQTKANAAINVLDNALAKALDQQTTIGSVESRLEYTQSNLTTASENVTAAESVIRDADMAKEMTEYTKNNVLMQAAQSMLSQANQSASNALSLLQ
ncbi:MAG: flagellin [Selenomonadaceae bacterium]|nr:flagellin [Selenomonadaceae bacterium]